MLKNSSDALEARIYTQDFRVYGIMHLASNQDTPRLLNREDRAFLAVTKGIVYESGFVHPPNPNQYRAAVNFMTLPTNKILWVMGGRASQPRSNVQADNRVVYLLYKEYFLKGSLTMSTGTRFSDYLSNMTANKPFQTLQNVSLGLMKKGQTLMEIKPIEEFEFVTVNLANVGGIFDVAALPSSSNRSSAILSIEEG